MALNDSSEILTTEYISPVLQLTISTMWTLGSWLTTRSKSVFFMKNGAPGSSLPCKPSIVTAKMPGRPATENHSCTGQNEDALRQAISMERLCGLCRSFLF